MHILGGFLVLCSAVNWTLLTNLLYCSDRTIWGNAYKDKLNYDLSNKHALKIKNIKFPLCVSWNFRI